MPHTCAPSPPLCCRQGGYLEANQRLNEQYFLVSIANTTGNQIHPKHMAPSDMGPHPSLARKHILRCESQQHTVRPQKYLPQCDGMAALWHNSFWSACGLLCHHVRLRRSRDSPNVRKELWLVEFGWCGDTTDVSMFTTLV